ncbi:MAG TPA: TonB-dependent receptor [Burkholderiaceae bacterium]|nr:TonB-dependent receptor [Burkholderiaceae bacterium]
MPGRRLAPTLLCRTPMGLACALLAPCVFAQADAPTGDAQAVVVTGSLRAQQVIDAPYAIGVVDAQTLHTSGPMVNLSEALHRVPGLTVANRNNYAQDLQISSRGFGARAGFGVRGLRLYTDGIPATMPDGQGQVAHFDLAGASRIEVLRGPFSVLYGNSSGGVIALFTAPATVREAELALDAGSFGLRQERISLALPMQQGFDLRANVSRFDIDGFRPQSAADRTLGNVRLGWRGDFDTVTLLVSGHRQNAQDPLGLTRQQFDADPLQTAPQATQFNTRKSIEQTQGGANWQHRFDSDQGLVQTNVTAYLGTRGVTQFLAIPIATQVPPQHGGGVIDFDRDYNGIDARALLRFGQTDLVLGVNQERQVDDRQGYENFIGTPPNQMLGVQGNRRRDETDRATSTDVYAQAETPLSSTWQLVGGVRSGQVKMEVDDRYIVPGNGDDSGSVKYSYTNPVIGVRWRAGPQWTLHASAARGTESPTLGELAYRPDGGPGFNFGLQAQTSRQVEVGSKWRSEAVDLDAALFLINTDNEIGVATNAGGRSSFQNVGRTRRYGAEAAAVWRLAPGLRAQANITLLNAEYRDNFFTCNAVPCTVPNALVPAGNRIAGTQRVIGSAELAWRPGAVVPGEFGLEWHAQGATPVDDLNSDFAAGFGVVGLRWSMDLAVTDSGTLQLLLRADNIFDRSYAGSVIVNEANKRFFETGAPRNGLISLRWLQKF